METWKYFDITHKDHVICNPMSEEKIDEMIGLLDLPLGAQVIDIACGKGEVLVRLAENYNIRGLGVDASPYCVRDAREKVRARIDDPGVQASVEVIEGDGADVLQNGEWRRWFPVSGSPDSPGAGATSTERPFQLAMCIGASWVFGGHRGTLEALASVTAEGGQVLVGEPFFKQTPDPLYLESEGFTEASFLTHAGNVAAGVEVGLTPLYTIVSSGDDWDRYECLQWRAAERYAASRPDDPDVPELLKRVRQSRDAYLKWGRSTLGWALYLFRKG